VTDFCSGGSGVHSGHKKKIGDFVNFEVSGYEGLLSRIRHETLELRSEAVIIPL
jgi:hypothetical protein